MNAFDLLQHQIAVAKNATESLLADMADAPLTAPTPNGGNHPLWIAGHLAYSEARLMTEVLTGEDNSLTDWKQLYSNSAPPVYDAAAYPHSLPELLSKWNEIRTLTLKKLDGLSEADLDGAPANCPAGREQMFGTVGKVFAMVAMHPMTHRGQVADARRALGRVPLMS